MGVGELIEQIRSLYITALQDALIARAALQVEPIENRPVGAGQPSGTRARLLPRRHDGIAANAEGGEMPFAVDSEGVLGFEPLSFAWGDDLSVRLLPFCWDFVEFEVPNAGLKNVAENLSDWHERWFTPDKKRVAAVDVGLLGVLHALSAVADTGGNSVFQVDFGSAPVACFEDLLDVLIASRAASVTVREAV